MLGRVAKNIITIVSFLSLLYASMQAQSLRKNTDDESNYFTNVGNIALTVTNFGTIGTRNRFWPDQPSCEYPRGSRIEHLYQGGLWIGAVSRKSGLHLVTTGVTDRAGSSGEGYEFTTELGERTLIRSTLSDSRFFNENAVSHQDLVSDYTDRHTHVPATGDSILSHIPLGIVVHQESYAWNFPFAESFVLLNYTIINAGNDILDSVYVGLWNNAVVRNTNYVRPGTTGYFDYGGNGFDSLARMMYTFEFQPTPGISPAESYLGVSLLGAEPFPSGVDSLGDLHRSTYFNAWRFRGSSGDQAYFSPTDDENSDRYLSRYKRLAQPLPPVKIAPLRTAPGNYTTLLSSGPFRTMRPGDSVRIVFAVVCAKKAGKDLERLDGVDQRANLNSSLTWVQQTYVGEDLNGNNILDPGEDLNGNGILDRYLLPSPPRQPKVHVEVESQNVVVYWDRTTAEESIDPISKRKDFEGYRIYRSTPGADFLANANLLLNLNLVGEFDRADDNVGYNTGFGQILLASPRTFAGDTNKYWYRFPPATSSVKHLNGWQYVYGVSAFDQGDPANNLGSLESAKSVLRVVPGTPPNIDGSQDIGVYPNPYYARAIWDGPGERTRKLYFYNLPARSRITIYTVAGDLVAELEHDAATYTGNEIDWFQRYGDQSQLTRFGGGEHAWNLISKYDQAIASGLYLFAVKDNSSGVVKRGKFVVVK